MLKTFGKLPYGNALERINRSAQFDGKQFRNELYTVMMSEDLSMVQASVQFFKPRPAAQPPKAFSLKKTNLLEIPANEYSLVWFGHSSYLLNLQGLKVLVDPVMSGHASPFPGMVKSFAGSDLYQVNDFPEIDILVLTHDHYDHLDYKFVSALRTKVKQVVCSLGVGAHLLHWGYKSSKIAELDWNERFESEDWSLQAQTARHFSGRGVRRNRSLWSSFVLQHQRKRIYIGGDSGYGPHFKRIGEQFGGFDLALLECGQYNVQWPQIHMQPEETVQAAIDLNAKVLMPVHWGKFKLALHDWNEPVERVLLEALKWQVPLLLPAIGENVYLFEAGTNHWWRDQV